MNSNNYNNDYSNENLSVHRYSNNLLNFSNNEYNQFAEDVELDPLNTAFFEPENESENNGETGEQILPEEVNLNATLPTGGRRKSRRGGKRIKKRRTLHRKVSRKVSRRRSNRKH